MTQRNRPSMALTTGARGTPAKEQEDVPCPATPRDSQKSRPGQMPLRDTYLVLCINQVQPILGYNQDSIQPGPLSLWLVTYTQRPEPREAESQGSLQVGCWGRTNSPKWNQGHSSCVLGGRSLRGEYSESKIILTNQVKDLYRALTWSQRRGTQGIWECCRVKNGDAKGGRESGFEGFLNFVLNQVHLFTAKGICKTRACLPLCPPFQCHLPSGTNKTSPSASKQ